MGVGSSDSSIAGSSAPSTPLAVAKLYTPPALISSCVRAYIAVKVVLSLSPGSKSIGPPVTVTNGSVIVMLNKGTSPLLVIIKV